MADAQIKSGDIAVSPGKPKPTRETVALERLTFDARLQMRDLGGALFDDATVAEYVEALNNGAQFPPLEAVREDRKGKEPVYWVFGGFTRGAAYRRWGKANSVPVLVYPGSFLDAQFYALSENRTHGQRTNKGDKQKAVFALIDTSALLARVKGFVRTGNTLHMAIAAACSVSVSTVDDALRSRNLGVNGTSIVPRQPRKSNDEQNLSGTGLTQAPVGTNPVPDPEPEPEPEPVEDEEPLYTVPVGTVIPEPAPRPAPVIEEPSHPFADIMSDLTSVTRRITAMVRSGDETGRRLHDYLAWAGLLDHPPADDKSGNQTAVFLPLKGVRRIIDLAGQPGKALTQTAIRKEYDTASGGWVPPAVLRRRNAKKGGAR